MSKHDRGPQISYDLAERLSYMLEPDDDRETASAILKELTFGELSEWQLDKLIDWAIAARDRNPIGIQAAPRLMRGAA